MRYFLLNRGEDYFIVSRQNSGIIFQAICQACKPIASVDASSPEMANRHLYTIALFHFMRSSGQNLSVLS